MFMPLLQMFMPLPQMFMPRNPQPGLACDELKRAAIAPSIFYTCDMEYRDEAVAFQSRADGTNAGAMAINAHIALIRITVGRNTDHISLANLQVSDYR